MTSGVELSAKLRPFDAADVRRSLQESPVVVFGAGGLGKRIAQVLRKAGITPYAFLDNNRNLWGSKIEGIDVLRPEAAARSLANSAVFVIAVWHPVQSGGLRAIERQLRDWGCRQVVPFAHVLWSFPEDGLPHYLWDLPSRMEPEWDAIHRAHDLFEDEASRAEFLSQVEFRLTANFNSLPTIETHPQYFPEFLKPVPGECFVDCGAYDGDSIASFIDWSGGQFRRIVAFEADPNSFKKLQEFAAQRPEIVDRMLCEQVAVRNTPGTVRFNATGQAGAAMADDGEIEVQSVTLDDALRGEDPTFLKMDIEGAEPDALLGAWETIRRTRPILAICVYHRQNHLWQLPLLMRELLPEAKLFLRSYCMDGFDTVCYAVPEHRLVNDRGAL